MKRLITLTLISTISITLMAQERNATAIPFENILSLPNSDFRAEGDTVASFTLDDPCAETAINFTTDLGGFVNGNNGYGDKEKVQLIFLPSNGTGTISEVLVYFGGKVLGDDGNVTAVVYGVDESDATPGTLLGESDPVAVSVCDTAGGFTVFSFPGGTSEFTDIFYAGINFDALYASGDSLGLLSTDDGCGNGEEVYELWSDNSWYPYVGEGTWGLNITLFVYAVTDWEVDVPPVSIEDEFVSDNDLMLHPAFPNPAYETIQINYSLNSNSDVRLEVYDMNGRLAISQALGSQSAGSYNYTLNTSNLESGKYYYSVEGGSGRLFSSFQIIK